MIKTKKSFCDSSMYLKMKRVRQYSITVTLLIVGLFTSCNQGLDSQEMLRWVTNSQNGLNQVKSFGPLEVSLLYKPIDYQIAQNIENGIIEKGEIDRERAVRAGMDYFTLRFAPTDNRSRVMDFGLKTEEDYFERISHLMFPLREDLKLISNTDTLECKSYHFVRDYDLAPYIDVVFAFEQADNTVLHDRILVYNDKLFSLGELNYTFKKEDLKNIPSLKY